MSDQQPPDDPPILGTWRNMYALVIGVLVVEIIVFYALSRWLA
jgi:hypothetical protein